MTDIKPLTLNPQPRIEIRPLGSQERGVFIVDDVLADPDALVDSAARTLFGAPPAASKYPGRVAVLSQTYVDLMSGVLQQAMAEVFGLNPPRRLPAYGFFGLSTVPADRMAPGQAAPHTDAHRLHSFATVHYLSRTDFGGTAFYRHKATGSDLITPIGSDKFNYLRRKELEDNPGMPLHALYDEIDYVEPRFNRLILYRAGQLHSARLNPQASLTNDPRTGRLTANLFFNTEGL